MPIVPNTEAQEIPWRPGYRRSITAPASSPSGKRIPDLPVGIKIALGSGCEAIVELGIELRKVMEGHRRHRVVGRVVRHIPGEEADDGGRVGRA